MKGDLRRGGVWWPEEPIEASGTTVDIDVVIPALDEEESLPLVLDALPGDWLREVVVVDNGSTDRTAEVAREAGATVVAEPRRGYGSACLKGLEVVGRDPPDIVVFLDADFSDVPEELPRVVAPILEGDAELVIGSRALGVREEGALLPQAVFGNKLACLLMELMYGYRFTDLGPFRAVEWSALKRLEMNDPDFGWTVEMQARAARRDVSAVEVPVSYRKGIGPSKVTGTVRGTIMASYKILYTLAREYIDELTDEDVFRG